MAGLQDMHLARVYRSLHARGLTTTTIADQLGTSRAYVSRVLSGYERYGRTWERIRSVLTAEEIALLEAMPLPDKPSRAWAGLRRRSRTVRARRPRPEGVSAPAAASHAAPMTLTRPTCRDFEQWLRRQRS